MRQIWLFDGERQDGDALEVFGQRFYHTTQSTVHSTTFDDWVPHLSKPMVVICRAHRLYFNIKKQSTQILTLKLYSFTFLFFLVS